MKGERYQFGEKIGELAPSAKSRGGKTNLDLYCEEVPIDHYRRVCYGDYCNEWTYQYTEWVTVCSSTGGGGGGSEGGGGGNGSGNGGGGNGGGSGGGPPAEPEIILANIGDPTIPNIQKYLDCFGANQYVNAGDYNFKITVYVQEPMAGSGTSSSSYPSGPINVGHVCIGLTKTDKNDPGLFVNQVIGWYPQGTPVFGPVPPRFVNNASGDPEGFTYTTSISYDVDAGQFARTLYGIASLTDGHYSLANFNCTTFAFAALECAGGLSIPKTSTLIGTQMGYTPGQLGEDLRGLVGTNPNIRITPGIPPRSKGPCD